MKGNMFVFQSFNLSEEKGEGGGGGGGGGGGWEYFSSMANSFKF